MSYRLMSTLSRTERICFDLAFYILTIAANVLAILTLERSRWFVASPSYSPHSSDSLTGAA
jgi:hypothetical protein